MINDIRKSINKIRNINENKELLNEYITKNMVYLRDYFRMSKEAKMEYLPHEYCYFFDDYLEEKHIDFDKPDEIGYDIELITWLENNKPEIYNEFAEYLYDKIENFNLNISDSDYPAWSFFDDDPKVVKNQWLIHFTDNAKTISTEGFRYAVDDMTKIGLTTHLSEFDKSDIGYCFAYTLDDFHKYGRAASFSSTEYKYGSEAVIFNASGIEVWHYGDEEPQVIFYSDTAKNIIPITGGEELDYGVYNINNGRLIYESNDMNDIVKWVETNFRQYRKQLSY